MLARGAPEVKFGIKLTGVNGVGKHVFYNELELRFMVEAVGPIHVSENGLFRQKWVKNQLF